MEIAVTIVEIILFIILIAINSVAIRSSPLTCGVLQVDAADGNALHFFKQMQYNYSQMLM